MEWLSDPHMWASLLTLTALEIVLGIDNLIFLSILVDRLPPRQQAHARRVGLILALGMRLGLLATIAWIMRLTEPVVAFIGHAFSWRDVILILGGLFLVYKGTREIHARVEGGGEDWHAGPLRVSFFAMITQIVLLDMVFSLDSVITAVGMVSQLPVMMAAVVVAVGIMLIASGPVTGFVNRHPTVKMLALSFLLLIGMTLIADGFGAHMPRAYIYAAIGFASLVELLNHLAGRARRPSYTKMSQEPGTDVGRQLELPYVSPP